MIDIKKSEIEFNVDGKKYNFTVIHNLSELGLDIENALHSWVSRTKKFTEDSFCKYVMSKAPDIICLSQKQYKRLNGN